MSQLPIDNETKTVITLAIKDRDEDPICRMLAPGRMSERYEREIHEELLDPHHVVNAVIEIRSNDPAVGVIHLDQDKTVIETREREEANGFSLWARKCPMSLVDFHDKQVATTKYHAGNNLRMLRMLVNGHLQVTVISVTSQDGKVFFNHQLIMDVQCYRRDGHIVLPADPDVTDKWRLDGLLDELYADWIDDLPDASAMPVLQPTPAPTDGDEGIVLWYSLAMGVGAIRTAKGDARVYWKNVPPRDADEFRYLVRGERVVYGDLVVPQTKPDHRQTAYVHEATGIKLLAA